MNLLDYEIISNCFHITNQWEPLRNSGRIGYVDHFEIKSVHAPALNGFTLFLRGSNESYDKTRVELYPHRTKIIPILETLSKIPILHAETKSGPIEYIEICNALRHGYTPTVIIHTRDQEDTRRIHYTFQHESYWAESYRSIIKIEQRRLDLALSILDKPSISKSFFLEPKPLL